MSRTYFKEGETSKIDLIKIKNATIKIIIVSFLLFVKYSYWFFPHKKQLKCSKLSDVSISPPQKRHLLVSNQNIFLNMFFILLLINIDEGPDLS